MRRTFGLLAASMVACSAFAQDVVKLRGDVWLPYNGDAKLENPGFLVEVARTIFKKAGITVDYEAAGWTWERSIAEAQKGTIDGIVGAAPSDAPDFIFPEEAACNQRMTFFVKKGNPWKFTDIASLKTVRLGVISGYAYDEAVDKYVEENKADEEHVSIAADDASLELNIKKLQAGRLDVVIEDKAVFAAKAKEMGLADQLEEAGHCAGIDPICIAFTPAKDTSARYAKVLSDGIKELKASGELAKLMSKYSIPDYSDAK